MPAFEGSPGRARDNLMRALTGPFRVRSFVSRPSSLGTALMQVIECFRNAIVFKLFTSAELINGSHPL